MVYHGKIISFVLIGFIYLSDSSSLLNRAIIDLQLNSTNRRQKSDSLFRAVASDIQELGFKWYNKDIWKCQSNENRGNITSFLKDSLIKLKYKVPVIGTAFDVRKEERIRKAPGDLGLEMWEFRDEKKSKEVFNRVGYLIHNYTEYEKPPKICLIKGRYIFLISAFGDIYSNKLARIRDMLEKKQGMKAHPLQHYK